MKIKYLRSILLSVVFYLFFIGNSVNALAAEAGEINTEQDERGKFLKQLYVSTRSQSEELINSGQFDASISLVQKSIYQLQKDDYQKNPFLTASLYSLMGEAYMEAAWNVARMEIKGEANCPKNLDSEIASGFMNQSIQSQRKAIELYKKTDSLSILTVNLSCLAGYYESIQDLQSAEKAYKEAIACAENGALEGRDKDRALFNSKMDLARFYKSNHKYQESRELAGELEIMVEQGRSGIYTKEDVMDLRDK